jgi:nifR3 family TIM-barrel protein
MQLYGSDPDIMAEGALWAVRHGATVVDINMGCPVDKVTKKDGGSRLLCIPDTAVEIARRCARAIEPFGVPLTCKMRLGWFDDQPVAVWLAPRLIDAGAQAITVHGRTTQQKFSGVVSHDGIARVVEAVEKAAQRSPAIPVIGNGDVREAHDVVAMIAKTGCKGVMIGRGALSTPWLFRDAWTLQTQGFVPPEPTTAQKLDLVRMYLDLMLRHRGEHYALVQMRRRISWFGKRLGRETDHRGIPVGCKPLREAMRTIRTPDEARALLDRFEAGELRGGGYDAPVEEAAASRGASDE